MGNKSFIFRFGDVEVREREFTLIKAGKVLAVEPKAFRALLFLLHNPQRLISKEELLNSLWGDAAVTEGSLTRCIWLLRRLLADDIHEPRYIETVATVGYRFVCPVEVSEDGYDGEPAHVSAETAGGAIRPRPRSLRQWWLLAAAVFGVGLASLIWYLHRPLSPLRISEYSQLTHNGHAGYVAGTDGSRLYLQGHYVLSLWQVAVSGGEIEPVSSITLSKPWLLDLSPDGSTLLVQSFEKGLSLSAPLYTVQVVGGSHRYLADAVNATWSPDGKLVAYSTATGDIDIINSDGTGAHKLASVGRVAIASRGVTAGYISWSPDGETIRFFRQNSNSIWEMTSSGSSLHPLLADWHPSWAKCCGHWSPDGRFFVFLTGPDGTESQIYALDEQDGLFHRRAKEPFQLTSGPIQWDTPVFSKDGKKIFATGFTRRGELVRLDPKLNQFQPFLGGISADLIAFSKDGQSVAYVTFPDGILWRANRDGSNRVQLTSPPLEPSSVVWSPDGSQIVFQALSPQGYKAWVVPATGGSPQRLLPEDTGQETDPSWSPDGRKMILATSIGGFSSQESSIRILDLASHQITTLPESDGKFSPHWSPDGQFIYADSLDTSTLYIFDIKTQRWSTLYKGIFSYGTWSRDSRSIYLFRFADDPAILRVPVTGGEAKVVVALKGFPYTGAFGTWFGLDPTDEPLILHDVSTTDVYELTLEGK